MCTNSNTQPSNGQQLSPDAFIENSQNDTQKMNTFTAYEKAIEGYQFQVGRYNIWMNYYAIFVGALFVALYSIWPKSEIETLCCACKPVCGKAPAAVAESQEWFLPLIISVLGWIASLCWYGALLGYRKWNEHWIKVVQGIEMVLNKDVYPNVYTAQPERPQKESLWKRIKNIFRCRMFICPRKRYLCCIKHCISICKFLKNIFGGQTGDKISHTKRKKNNKTTSQKNVLNCKRHGLSLAIILLCLSSSLGCRVRFCIISETPKAIVLHTKRKKQ